MFSTRLTAGFVVRNGMNMKEIMTRIEMVAENQENLSPILAVTCAA